MDERFFGRLNQICSQIQQEGAERLFLFPFGYNAMDIYTFLKARTDFEIVRVDEGLSRNCDSVINFDEMLAVGSWGSDESTDRMILTSSNLACYQELRLKVDRYIKRKKLTLDLFPRNPLIFHEDARIGALAAAAEKIYRRGIEGSVAEAGVYQGDFAHYINMLFPDRKFYLFDTFEGFHRGQLHLEMDSVRQTEDWIDTLRDTSEELVMSKMTYPDLAEIRKGLFPGTAGGVSDRFAFVNLDMDLYMPTYEGLKFFWERLSPGGILFVHDFGNWDGVDRAVERFCREFRTEYLPLNDGLSIALVKGI